MPWVRFCRDHDWHQPGFTIAYKSGMHMNVTRSCASDVTAAGAAEYAGRPRDGEKTKLRRAEAEAVISA